VPEEGRPTTLCERERGVGESGTGIQKKEKAGEKIKKRKFFIYIYIKRENEN